jgi:hypothetical protein
MASARPVELTCGEATTTTGDFGRAPRWRTGGYSFSAARVRPAWPRP